MSSKIRNPDLLSGAEADVLTAHLEDEVFVQEQLLELLVEKGKALVANDVPALSEALKKGNPLVDRLRELTCRRARLVQNLSRPRNMPEADARFTIFAGLAPEGERPRIQDVLLRLKTLIARTELQNRKNRMLVRIGLDLNQAIVRSLFGEEQSVATYDRGAKPRTAQPSRPFMCTEV